MSAGMLDGPTYNPFLPEVREDPYPTYHALRAADPVHRSPFMDVWILTRYADVERLLRDPRFSSDRRGWSLLPPMADDYRPSMLSLDPPDHTRLRALVSRAFTPRLVDRLRPWVEDIVAGVLDRARDRGSLEVVEELAFPMPLEVICRMLGVPAADWPRFREWTRALVVSLDPLAIHDEDGMAAFQRAEREFLAYLAGVLDERRRAPGDDLISALAAVEEQGAGLSEHELVIMVDLLLIAGHETTAGLIGNGVLALLRHPDQLALLRERPELVENAVEELLRWDSPAQLTGRVALEDCDLGGRAVRRGELVLGLIGAANRDPSRFPDPDRLDVRRSPNQHLALGRGAHFCLGAPLARMEGAVAIGELVRRFPELRLAGEPARGETITLRGLKALPVAL